MPLAIVLSLTKYSDTGSIVHLYTAEHGRMQYVVYGNRYKSVLRPLSIITYNTIRRTNAPNQLASISNCQLSTIHCQLSTDIQRQCVAMFIAEILVNTLRHPMNDEPLFDWLCLVIEHLDKDNDICNLHIDFLIQYASFLGIGIDDSEHAEWFVAPQSRSIRQQRLREITTYYEEHIEDFRQPKSLDVLMEVFD